MFTDDDAERGPKRSLKEVVLEDEVPVLRQTPVRVIEVEKSPRSEKRKEAPTDVEGREEERVKVARVEGRSLSPAREGEAVDALGMEGDEGLEVCFLDRKSVV